jgi:hypothetical protein
MICQESKNKYYCKLVEHNYKPYEKDQVVIYYTYHITSRTLTNFDIYKIDQLYSQSDLQ